MLQTILINMCICIHFADGTSKLNLFSHMCSSSPARESLHHHNIDWSAGDMMLRTSKGFIHLLECSFSYIHTEKWRIKEFPEGMGL